MWIIFLATKWQLSYLPTSSRVPEAFLSLNTFLDDITEVIVGL
jgi:hypothetical protein